MGRKSKSHAVHEIDETTVSNRLLSLNSVNTQFGGSYGFGHPELTIQEVCKGFQVQNGLLIKCEFQYNSGALS